MEKGMGENDIKGLEEEIDSAVDRLFVEKKGGTPESVPKKSPAKEPSKEPSYVKEPSYQMEKDIDLESPVSPMSPVQPSSAPPPFLQSIEKMESQLLSLEWEITKENLGKTKEEVIALRETLKEKPDIRSVLNLMDKVLNYMVKNEDKIRPPLVKFLLDSKETVKLLMKKEADSEINTFKQLAYVGIQARFSCLEEMKEAKPEPPPASLRDEAERIEVIAKREKQIEEILSKMNLFLEKAEAISRKVDQQMSRAEQGIPKPSEPVVKAKPVPVNVTVFKVEERLFGVESDKIYKLFKVPGALVNKYSSQEKVRFKEFEARMVDLRKVFSIPKGDRKEEIKILTVKEDGEYKGLMIDEVLEKLSTQSDMAGTRGEYFLGTIHWTYQDRSMEVPILNLRKF
jgi:hypothetical protein